MGLRVVTDIVPFVTIMAGYILPQERSPVKSPQSPSSSPAGGAQAQPSVRLLMQDPQIVGLFVAQDAIGDEYRRLRRHLSMLLFDYLSTGIAIHLLQSRPQSRHQKRLYALPHLDAAWAAQHRSIPHLSPQRPRQIPGELHPGAV